jgi:hypothetical protein
MSDKQIDKQLQGSGYKRLFSIYKHEFNNFEEVYDNKYHKYVQQEINRKWNKLIQTKESITEGIKLLIKENSYL